jgi:polar amino acid transport system substrate-binding protein
VVYEREIVKKIILCFVFMLTAFSIFASADFGILQKSKTLRVGWYDQYPFTYKKDVLGVKVLTGLDIELSKAIAKKSNFNLEFVNAPWETQLSMLKSGKIDVMLSGLKSFSRLKDFKISIPIRKERTAVYIRRNELKKINPGTIQSFLKWIKRNKLKIGITNGNIYTDEKLNDFIINQKNSEYIKAARCDLRNLQNLENCDVVAVFMDKTAAASIIYANNWEKEITVFPHLKFESRDVSYLLSKKTMSDASLEKINSALSLIKKNGKYNSIVKSYLFPELLNLTVNSWWYFYIILAGTIAYCICALRMVMEENQSLLGTLIFVSVYTIGGGAIRGILTGAYPLFFMYQPVYIYTILLLTMMVFVITNLYQYLFNSRGDNPKFKYFFSSCKFIRKIFVKYIYDLVDSIGLAAFVVFGVIAALQVKAEPLILWGPVLAMITTSGGGVICNMLRSYRFETTLKNMFTEIAAAWGLVLSVLLNEIAGEAPMNKVYSAVIITVIGAFFTRWLVCYFKIQSIDFYVVKLVRSVGFNQTTEH